MSIDAKTQTLAEFGQAVLTIMEDYNEWNADTLDLIVDAAEHRGLCEQSCEFKVTEDGKL